MHFHIKLHPDQRFINPDAICLLSQQSATVPHSLPALYCVSCPKSVQQKGTFLPSTCIVNVWNNGVGFGKLKLSSLVILL